MHVNMSSSSPYERMTQAVARAYVEGRVESIEETLAGVLEKEWFDEVPMLSEDEPPALTPAGKTAVSAFIRDTLEHHSSGQLAPPLPSFSKLTMEMFAAVRLGLGDDSEEDKAGSISETLVDSLRRTVCTCMLSGHGLDFQATNYVAATGEGGEGGEGSGSSGSGSTLTPKGKAAIVAFVRDNLEKLCTGQPLQPSDRLVGLYSDLVEIVCDGLGLDEDAEDDDDDDSEEVEIAQNFGECLFRSIRTTLSSYVHLSLLV
jgi:hypothetical protein